MGDRVSFFLLLIQKRNPWHLCSEPEWNSEIWGWRGPLCARKRGSEATDSARVPLNSHLGVPTADEEQTSEDKAEYERKPQATVLRSKPDSVTAEEPANKELKFGGIRGGGTEDWGNPARKSAEKRQPVWELELRSAQADEGAEPAQNDEGN